MPIHAARLAGIAALWLLFAGAPQTVVWPAQAWPSATPDSQGLDSAPFAALDKEIRDGAYGNVDRILVLRRGHAIVNQRYARDYKTISRGQVGPIGCGEGCTDASRMHEFNYFHPNWHPYYQGRDVHTLQSVTKSVAATVIGIAVGRGEADGLDRPFLQYFKDRDLLKVDPRLHRTTLADR